MKNSYEIFHKLVYDDKDKSLEEIMNWDFEKFKNTYVKVIIVNKTNPYYLDMFIDALEQEAIDVRIIEDSVDMYDAKESSVECENTIAILKNFINESEFQTDKKQLETFLVELYNEALTMEV
jgi:hypothetical protein